MADYNWMKSIKLVDTGRLRAPKTNTPEGLTLRILANGKVYPSQELVTKYNLEYSSRTELTGNGIDIVKTDDWELGVFKDRPKMVLIGFTNKNNSKVDLFGSCRYNTDGSPKTNVMTQGLENEKLLAIVKEMGWMSDTQKYCDLTILEEFPFKAEDGILNIPKTIERGEMKGQKTSQRRENETFYPLVTIEEFEEITKASVVTQEATEQEVPELASNETTN